MGACGVKSQADLLESYKQHLLGCCGVTEGTCALFIWHVSKFLGVQYGKGPPDWRSLQPRDLLKYISDLASNYKPNTRKSAVTALRSFLRWWQLNGCCDEHLVKAVPTVSSHKYSDCPVTLSQAELGVLLQSFDRSVPLGLRGYAAALCMARLGLRVGEVARITLDDVDWRAGTLRLSERKCRRGNLLPLPRDVGKALVDYLRKGRPPSNARHIFVRHYPPRGEPANRNILRADVYAAFQRTGLCLPAKGTRALRHTAATYMVRKGATLKEIADVLGHRSIDTTAIYAKVDLPRLVEVAMPWPEVKP